jgi:hypothetical protein
LAPVIRWRHDASSLASLCVAGVAFSEIRMGSFENPFSAIRTASAAVEWLRVAGSMCAAAPAGDYTMCYVENHDGASSTWRLWGKRILDTQNQNNAGEYGRSIGTRKLAAERRWLPS